MFDFRLQVFTAVATRLSFTKAAEKLFISQPAVTKHIKELEHQLQTQLFIRKGTRVALSPSGKILQDYAAQIRNMQRDLEFELGQLNSVGKGRLIIGASTTIAQYILPGILAKFNEYYKEIQVELMVHNSETITQLLANNTIDLGIVEGKLKSSGFRYVPFMEDEIVLVASAKHPLSAKTLSLKDLAGISFVARENGSGTQEFIVSCLKKEGIHYNELQTIIRLGSSEAIKNYLKHSDCMAFLSRSALRQELENGSLHIVPVRQFRINREFHFVLAQGDQSALLRLFLNFFRYNL